MTTLYLATGDGPIVVTGGAGRWRAARPLDVRSGSCIAVDRADVRRLLCGTARDGVWRSDDGGGAWQRVFERLPHERVTSLAISPNERGGDGRGVVYVGTEPSAVFRSDDGGATWRECTGLTDLPSSHEWSFPPRPHTHHARWIEADLHVPGLLHVAIEAGALVRSPDGGRTWIDRTETGPIDTHQLAIHPAAPGRLWSAAGDGFFESDDGGESWRVSERGMDMDYCWSLAVDSGDPETMIVSAAPGPSRAHSADEADSTIYRREGLGAWEETRSGLPDTNGRLAAALTADPAQPHVFYAAVHADEIFQSTDAGRTWEQLEIEWNGERCRSRAHVITCSG